MDWSSLYEFGPEIMYKWFATEESGFSAIQYTALSYLR